VKRFRFQKPLQRPLTCFNLTWEQTNGRQVLPAYDPRSQTFLVLLIAAPGLTGNQKILLSSMATLQL
jgi:hypothetical protein